MAFNYVTQAPRGAAPHPGKGTQSLCKPGPIKKSHGFAKGLGPFAGVIKGQSPLIILWCLIPLFAFGEHGYEEPWGKDRGLKYRSGMTEEQYPYRDRLSVKAAEMIILFHQNIISPVDGPRSHFRPTSARYMLLAMRRFGFIKGFIMGCDRLIRENTDPWIYKTIEIDGIAYKWDPTVDKS